MELYELIIFPDLAKLPKSDLKDMATNLNVDNTGVAFEIARRIWREADSKERKQKVFSPFYSKLLAGRTSVSWFKCDNLNKLIESIEEKEGIDPFSDKIPYDSKNLDTKPNLRSASRIDDDSYYLRFIYKDGTRRIVGEDVEILPTTNTATVYINEKKGIIEVRANPNDAQKIAEVIAGYLRQQLSLNKEDFIKPFGYNLEKLADEIGGTLSESKAAPEMWLDNLKVEENEALIDVLKAIDDYFENKELDVLQDKLDSAIAVLGEEVTEIPFIAIVLAGMGNVGLKVDASDLRNTAFYQLLKPYLQTFGGNIKFNVEINQIEKPFTIQVGVDSKSVYFRSNTTTEEVIEHVRNKIVL